MDLSGDNALRYPLNHRSAEAVKDGFLNDFSMRCFLAGRQLYDWGRHAHAAKTLEYGLLHDPLEVRLHLMLIVTHRSLGRMEAADRHLDRLMREFPSPDAEAVFRNFIDNWPYLPNKLGDLPPEPGDGKPRLSFSLLGIDGEFGNQLFQYAFARLYSEKYGLRLETYDWVGQKLFGLHDPPVSRIQPFILEIEYLRNNPMASPPSESGLHERDTQGYFQFDTRHYRPYRDRFLSLFQPLPALDHALGEFVREVRSRGNTLVTVHLRCKDAADQGRKASVALYYNWLKALWPALDRPILFLASDDLDGVRRDLEEFHPVTSERFGIPIPTAKFYPDFYALTQADHLAISDSTFSFAAAMLNTGCRSFFRPELAKTGLFPFDPWAAFPTLV